MKFEVGDVVHETNKDPKTAILYRISSRVERLIENGTPIYNYRLRIAMYPYYGHYFTGGHHLGSLSNRENWKPEQIEKVPEMILIARCARGQELWTPEPEEDE